jgi:hypothetical protein
MLNGQFLVALPNAVIVGAVLYSGRFWFPAFAPLAKDAIGMDKDGKSKVWGRVFIIIVIIITLVINVLQMRANS